VLPSRLGEKLEERLIAPLLVRLPVLPPSAAMPVELSTSVFDTTAPESTVRLLLLLMVTPAAPVFGVTVQPEGSSMSEPLVVAPLAGHAAQAAPPIRTSIGMAAAAVRRTLRI
jgi:hypothetical protein